MIEDAYNLEIIENVVNKRAEEGFIANYFYCQDRRYLHSLNTHSHLHNIDPNYEYYPIEKAQANRLDEYENEKCEFDM